MEAFRTLRSVVEAELRERGSRFLARAAPVADRGGAESFHAEAAAAFGDATHVVPAFVLRDGTCYASDAGEPAGSAGRPLLQAIAGAGLHDIAVVVARWYGGTKLGVGGLVRAYGGVLAAALAGAPTRLMTPGTRLTIHHSHERTAAVLRTVARFEGCDVRYDYGDGVTVSLTVPTTDVAAFTSALRDATQGDCTPERVGPAVIAR